ncbi:MAG: histidine phosphatase family protein [Synergistaceae bacterium]|nr:histidine phosphatase family protein [Synergistaceae bacterium]
MRLVIFLKLLLARHGVTDWNKSRRFQGRTDSELSADGILQAEKLSARLVAWKPDIVFTSPLKRAFSTASRIAVPNLKILPELEEINFGSWEGLSLDSLLSDQTENFLKWRNDPFFNPPHDGEKWPSIQERLTRAFDIMKSSGHERIIAVSHGGIIRALFCVILGFDPHTIWNLEVSNCSISEIEITDAKSTLIYANDVHHLEGSVRP